MKRTWMVFGGLFLASVAAADFSGTWLGSGTVVTPQETVQCSNATISLRQSETAIDVLGVDFECEGISLKQNPLSLTIQNGMDLYFQGQKVGMIMNDSIDATYTAPGPQGGTWIWHVTKKGDDMNYSEKTVGKDGSSWTISGKFKHL